MPPKVNSARHLYTMDALPDDLIAYIIMSPVELAQIRATCTQLRQIRDPFQYRSGGAIVTLSEFITANLSRRVRSTRYNYKEIPSMVWNCIEMYSYNGKKLAIFDCVGSGGIVFSNGITLRVAGDTADIAWIRRIFAKTPPRAPLFALSFPTAPKYPQIIRSSFSFSVISRCGDTFTHDGVKITVSCNEIVVDGAHVATYVADETGNVRVHGRRYRGGDDSTHLILAGLCEVSVIGQKI